MTRERKTRDEYEIQSNWGYGWECVTTEETWLGAREQVRCYRENQPEMPHRVLKKRVAK